MNSPQVQAVIDAIVSYYQDHDDSDEQPFGDFARVSVSGRDITILHETEETGVAIIVGDLTPGSVQHWAEKRLSSEWKRAQIDGSGAQQ